MLGQAVTGTYSNHLVLPEEGGEGIADPHFLRYNGRYYLYPTAGRDMFVKAWVSEDLIHWEYLGYVTQYDSLTLRLWGPHVKYWNGNFYMYVNSPGSGEGDHAQYVLRASRPEGPFVRQTGNLGVRLSPTVFVDDDHRWYLFSAGKEGVLGYPMDDPYTLVRPGRTLNAKMDFWTEGPKMFKRNDVYYLLFTGDHWLSRGYREGYATATDGPLGEFVMADNNPIAISTDDGFYGLGNGFILRGPDLDTYYFLYHRLLAVGDGNTRKLNVDPVVFNGRRLSVLGPTNFPQAVPKMPDFYTWLDEQGTAGWDEAAVGSRRLLVSPEATERYYTAEFNFHTAASGSGRIGVVFSYRDEDHFHYVVVDTHTARLHAYARTGGTDRLLATAQLPLDFDFTVLHTIRVENGAELKIFFDEMLKLRLDSLPTGGRIGYIYENVEPVFKFTAFSNRVNGSGAGDLAKPVPGVIEAVHPKATSLTPWNPYVLSEAAGVVRLTDGTYAIEWASGDWLEYALNVQTAGRYGIDLVVQDVADDIAIKVHVDGAEQGVCTLPARWEGQVKRRLCAVHLEHGEARLRLEAVEGRLTLRRLELYEVTEESALLHDPLTGGYSTGWKQFGSVGWRSDERGFGTERDGNAFVVAGDPRWTDYSVEVDITVEPGVELGSQGAGLLLRVTHPSYHDRQTPDSLMGYYVELRDGRLVLKRLNYGARVVQASDVNLERGKAHRLRAVVRDDLVQVYWDGGPDPVLEYADENTYMHGAVGLRTHRAGVRFANLDVAPVDAPVVTITSPRPGSVLASTTPVRIRSQVQPASVQVLLDGQLLYAGADAPDGLALVASELTPGRHVLEVAVEDVTGVVHRDVRLFDVEHLRLVSPQTWGQQIGAGNPIVLVPIIDADEVGDVVVELHPAMQGDNSVTLYRGPAVPTPIVPDPWSVPDGVYDLAVRATTVRGHVTKLAQRVVIDNWNELEDPLPPPQALGWLGVVDRMKTVDRSSGWEHVSGDAVAFFGDADRLRPAGPGGQHLTWEQGDVAQFEFTMYARKPDVAGLITIKVSADGSTWRPLPYTTHTVPATEGEWWRLTLVGTVPSELGARFVRLEVTGSQTGAEIQLGHVVLRSPKEREDT